MGSEMCIRDRAALESFIESLELPNTVKDELKKLTPSNYIGLASKLAR